MFLDFLARRTDQRIARYEEAAESAKRSAGSLTRGERDALRRKPTPVDVSKTVAFGGRTFRVVPQHTNPAKAAARADRTARKAARRSQSRGR